MLFMRMTKATRSLLAFVPVRSLIVEIVYLWKRLMFTFCEESFVRDFVCNDLLVSNNREGLLNSTVMYFHSGKKLSLLVHAVLMWHCSSSPNAQKLQLTLLALLMQSRRGILQALSKGSTTGKSESRSPTLDQVGNGNRTARASIFVFTGGKSSISCRAPLGAFEIMYDEAQYINIRNPWQIATTGNTLSCWFKANP